MSTDLISGDAQTREDDRDLAEVGYRRETARTLNERDSAGTTTSVFSVLTGPVGLVGYGLITGGTAAMLWTWVASILFVRPLAKSMGELTSAYPALGGPFLWTGKLAKKESNKRLLSWIVAWLNVTGDFAGTAFAGFGAAIFIGALAQQQFGFAATKPQVVAISAGIMALAALLNTFAVRWVGWLNQASFWVHVLGVLFIVFALFAFAPHHQPAHFVFTHYVNETGWSSRPYVIGLCCLIPMLTFTGGDASAHLADETRNAKLSAPKAIVRSVDVTWALGVALFLAVAFCIQDGDKALANPLNAMSGIIQGAVPSALATTLIVWIIVAQIMCVISCMTAGSRMIYGAARDRALPGSPWLHHLNAAKVPARGVWVLAVGSFAMCLSGLGPIWAFYAVTSFAAVALFVAYTIPIALRLIHHRDFHPRAYALKRPRLTAVWSVGYVIVAGVLACLPATRDFMHPLSFNWAPVLFAAVLLLVLGHWLVWGRKRYKGPINHVGELDLQALEAA